MKVKMEAIGTVGFVREVAGLTVRQSRLAGGIAGLLAFACRLDVRIMRQDYARGLDESCPSEKVFAEDYHAGKCR
jgi:hypothetical protein